MYLKLQKYTLNRVCIFVSYHWIRYDATFRACLLVMFCIKKVGHGINTDKNILNYLQQYLFVIKLEKMQKGR